MANQNEESKTTRKIIPVMLTLLILGIFLTGYFLKYIPERQGAYNRRAFMELEQIEKAAQSKNNAYTRAIGYFLANARSNSPLLLSFRYKPYPPGAFPDTFSRHAGPSILSLDSATNYWQLTYPLLPSYGKGAPICMSIRFDSILAPVISTYQDIFENYLVIRRDTAHNGHGQVIFNSGDLSMDYQVYTDSLLKKSDGFSLLNVHDVSVEGNPNKLFIYPFQLGGEQLILAGLTSTSDYTAGFKTMPLNLIIPTTIIILLLLINLPILKVFILGIYESISDQDIRLIIGSYFVAAFAGFFLFSWLFLLKIQSVNNRKDLEQLSTQVQKKFITEIDSIGRQLQNWDTIYARQIVPDFPVLGPMYGHSQKPGQDSLLIDRLLQPHMYPYLDYVFWIDSSGKWVASWSAKKKNGTLNLLPVADRKYFKDFINRSYLELSGGSRPFAFTIEPTLSKLDGEYTITVVTPSAFSYRSVSDTLVKDTLLTRARPDRRTPTYYNKPAKDTPLSRRPMLVGLSAQMYSVTNTILPAGYNFSIIDESGQVLYDSRQGRALLTNILKESENPSSLLECAHYRNHRYFNDFGINGQQTALLATPVPGMPYTLLTYYNLSGEGEFQLHLIGLSAIFTGCILLLLIFSTLINRWTGMKPGILLSPSKHFEWLRPLPGKRRYYQYLCTGMLCLLLIYAISWILIRLLPRQLEFSLFFISLLFPFYVALFYYLLRETEKQKTTRVLKPLMPVLTYLAIVILVINSFTYWNIPSAGWLPVLTIIAQAAFFFTGRIFILRFAKKRGDRTETPPPVYGSLRTITPPPPSQGPRRWNAWMESTWVRFYAFSIITGVVTISIIPACGIFWLLFREETHIAHNSSRIETARAINARRVALNQKMNAYKFVTPDASSTPYRDSVALRQSKFSNGIYLLDGDGIDTTSPNRRQAFMPVSTQYNAIHRLIFPEDSNVISSSSYPDSAEDGSWRFFSHIPPANRRVRLEYDNTTNDRVDEGPLLLSAGPEASLSALHLMIEQIASTGALFIFLYFGAELLCVFMAYKITRSLASRIFLIDMFSGNVCPGAPLYGPADLSRKLKQIRMEEKDLGEGPPENAEKILCNRTLYADLYEKKWAPLSPMEKYILYDLAKDGFANYKTSSLLYDLLQKDLLAFERGHLELITRSFQEYVLERSEDPAITDTLKKARQKGTWQAFKMPLMILFATFGLFIFFTQDALYQKLTGLLTSLISMRTLLGSFLGGNSKPAGDQDKQQE